MKRFELDDNDDAERDREARDHRRRVNAEIRAEYSDEEWARFCEEAVKASEFDDEPEPISDEEKEEFWRDILQQHEM